MEVLAEESWTWMLFEHEGTLLLSVLCGSVALYTVDFILNEKEKAMYEKQGAPYLKQLSRTVSWQPESYRDRQLVRFEQLPGVKEATATWREGHATASGLRQA